MAAPSLEPHLSGPRPGNALTHNGQPVSAALNGNVYTGTAGGKTIFTLTVNANGSRTFRLPDQLEHADGNNPNDIIRLDFSVITHDDTTARRYADMPDRSRFSPIKTSEANKPALESALNALKKLLLLTPR
ncbi:MAG: hypothetical protein WC989_04230 [Micavibrio sp.]